MDRVLWVDAICIDQSNERERGHQVQQMCKTYSQAEEVVVWLGQATEVTDVFMESLQRLDEYSSMHEHRHWDLAQWTTFWHLVPKNPRFAPQEAMNALLWRPWFERVWILQEIANAKKASILCGTKSVRARTFALAPSLVGVTPDRHSQAVLDIMPGRLRENTWWTENRDLYNLLLKFSESKASDPRDKVYALLGISSDAQNTDSLRPDYTRSLQNAIHDTSSFLFGPSDVPYETMSEFLEDLTFRSMASFVKLLKMSDASEVDRFLKCRGLEVPLSEDMIRAAAANERNGREILSLLLREREKEVIVTKGVMKAARENTTSGIVITDLLLRHCKVQIRQAVARELWVAFRYGYPGVREQLSFVKDDAKMYDAIHELVWQAPPIAFGIAVEMLLLDTGPNVDVENDIKAAATPKLYLDSSMVDSGTKIDHHMIAAQAASQKYMDETGLASGNRAYVAGLTIPSHNAI
ncbi:unnamed protein product [Alternaria sp. RS040]